MADIETTPPPASENLVQPVAGVAEEPGAPNPVVMWVAVGAAALLLGVGTGYAVFAKKGGSVSLGALGGGKPVMVKTKTEEGVKDAANFKDTAEGILQANDGKLTKEGTHILIRGDASQNVYLTSSVVDMDKFIGKKVQVWGETFQGQKAGWLMDVGRIKVSN